MSETTAAPKAIRPIRDFNAMVAGQFRKFFAGQLINDAETIAALLSTNCANYVAEVDGQSDRIACPRCKELNRVDSSSVTVRIARAPIVLSLDRQVITFQPGSLIYHRHLIEAAEAAGYSTAMEPGTALRCTKCANVWC